MRAIEDGAISASSSADDVVEDGLVEIASGQPDRLDRSGANAASDGGGWVQRREQDSERSGAWSGSGTQASPRARPDRGDGSSAEPKRPTAADFADHFSEKTPATDTADSRDSADPLAGPNSDTLPDVAYSPLFDEGLGPARRERRRVRPEQTPTQRALGLLTRREHSRKELTRKLTSRGLDREEVVAAVDRLADAGWQNDHRFAESLVRSRAGNGYGPVHIRAELNMHGLDSEAIAQALAAYEGNWLENARDLLRRRFGEDFASDPALRRKAADLLMRRGFDGDTARNANRFCAED
ncbi:recombination regulator RecX [Lysobacter capsici]|nr:recombination regulator RecX [Lysobacter capsici]